MAKITYRLDRPQEHGTMDLQEFATTHQLTLVVARRPLWLTPLKLYYAAFEYVEVMKGGFLSGAHGNGNTPEEAIRDYAKALEGNKIAYRAMSAERREIQCPDTFTLEF